MKKIIIIILLDLVIGSFGAYQLTKSNNANETNIVSESEEEKNIEDEEEKNVIDEDTTEIESISEDEDKSNNIESNSTSNNNNTSSEKQQASKSSQTTNNDSITNNQTETNTETRQEVVTESKTEEPKVEDPITPNYVGVPDPNNPDYSFHHGVIQYSTYDECYNAGIELLFQDSSIRNFWSIPVRDSQNTVLGYYLYIER